MTTAVKHVVEGKLRRGKCLVLLIGKERDRKIFSEQLEEVQLVKFCTEATEL